MFPKLLQRLFANEGAGPKLRADILPLDDKTLGVNGEGAVTVQLSDAVNSEDSTTAASSNAVKTVWDKANSAAASANAAQSAATAAKTAADTAQGTADAAKTAAAAAQTKANSAYTEATKTASTSAAGRVQLSDAVNSASSTTAASSKAVKTAYDAGVAAAATANAAKTTATSAQTKANSAYTLAEAASFPKGTRLLFHQAAAPTGWTKQTTVNDAALRVVSGTTGGGTGGSVAFSTLFAAGKTVTLSGNVGATTLTTAQMPKHGHTLNKRPGYSTVTDVARVASGYPTSGSPYTNTTDIANTGGSTSHTHTLSGKATIALNVKYTDVIICAKA